MNNDPHHDEVRKYRFSLRLVIKHPTISYTTIAESLPLKALHGHNVGDLRTSPKGTLLGGNWNETYWGYSTLIEGQRYFFDSAVEFCRSLESHTEFFLAIVKSGGLVGLYLDLLGDDNIGDCLKPEDMAYIASMGISLGVEFFRDS